jgi:hypothetical protein
VPVSLLGHYAGKVSARCLAPDSGRDGDLGQFYTVLLDAIPVIGAARVKATVLPLA